MKLENCTISYINKMSIYSMTLLYLVICCIAQSIHSFRIESCYDNKPIKQGGVFVFGCVADEQINYCKVQHKSKVCKFRKEHNVMKAQDNDCAPSLKDRISVHVDSLRTNCTFEISNININGK